MGHLYNLCASFRSDRKCKSPLSLSRTMRKTCWDLWGSRYVWTFQYVATSVYRVQCGHNSSYCIRTVVFFCESYWAEQNFDAAVKWSHTRVCLSNPLLQLFEWRFFKSEFCTWSIEFYRRDISTEVQTRVSASSIFCIYNRWSDYDWYRQ